MLSKKFKSLPVGKRQEFLALLNMCEADGVTDIRFVREYVQRSVDDDFRSGRLRMSGEAKRRAVRGKKVDGMAKINGVPAGVKVCPECGRGRLWPALGDDGVTPLPENVWVCGVCRWSEMRGG